MLVYSWYFVATEKRKEPWFLVTQLVLVHLPAPDPGSFCISSAETLKARVSVLKRPELKTVQSKNHSLWRVRVTHIPLGTSIRAHSIERWRRDSLEWVIEKYEMKKWVQQTYAPLLGCFAVKESQGIGQKLKKDMELKDTIFFLKKREEVPNHIGVLMRMMG